MKKAPCPESPRALCAQQRAAPASGTCPASAQPIKNIDIISTLYNDYVILASAFAQSIDKRACALRALGLLLADGAPTVGGGKTF